MSPSLFGPKTRVAIVGSGVSGLSAVYALRNSGHEVHLFEASNRLGGHTNTVQWRAPDNSNQDLVPVDTGFIVMNRATYPNFISFLKDIKVETVPTEMTFAVTKDEGAFEWCGRDPFSLFCQRRNLFRPSHWRMIFDIIRFNNLSIDLLRSPKADENPITIGDYLKKNGYSKSFRDDYLLPMTACVWSTGPEKCALDFPAVTLVRFMLNHQLLNTITERPKWMTISQGSIEYIKAIQKFLPPESVHLSTEVTHVKSDARGVFLSIENDKPMQFDAVILACHGDQALELLNPSATEKEVEVLQHFRTSDNYAVLHSDLSYMPKRRSAWSAWNYITTSVRESSPEPEVCLTYNMNILQHINPKVYGDVLVTLNPIKNPAPSTIQGRYRYRHPLYTNAAVAAQKRLHEIQGKRGIWFAGAWTGYGFHEDGFTSGIKVAQELGGSVPWEVQDLRVTKPTPHVSLPAHVVRLIITLINVGINIIIALWTAFMFPARHLGFGASTLRHGAGSISSTQHVVIPKKTRS